MKHLGLKGIFEESGGAQTRGQPGPPEDPPSLPREMSDS